MTAFFVKLLNMSIAASGLILAVIVLRLLLTKAPRWIRCVLWGIVAIRLICPVLPESALSLIPTAEIISLERTNSDFLYYTQSHSQEPAVNHALNSAIRGDVLRRTADSSEGIQIDHMPNSGIREENVPAAVNRSEKSKENANLWYNWMHAAAMIWMIGACGLLCYALILDFRLHQRVSEAIRLRENIWVCDKVKSPFILGVMRPRIYLSSSTNESQMGDILAHEQAHIKRKDHWWKLLGYLLLAIYWFNPLSWAAYILLCRDIELACDEKVIRRLNTDEKKRYANALVSCSMQRRVIMACPPAFGEVGVRRRVKSVLNYKRPAFAVVLISVFACLVVAICFLTTAPGSEFVRAVKPAAHSSAVNAGANISAAGGEARSQLETSYIDGTLQPSDTFPMERSYADETSQPSDTFLMELSYADGALQPADAFPMELLCASGASSSGNMMILNADGSFSGQYYDHENAAGADHSNGMRYICNYSGRFENIRMLNEYTCAMTLGEIITEQEEGAEWLQDGELYIAVEPYGLEAGKEFLLYAPGAPMAELSEEFLSWRMGRFSDGENLQSLPCYGLYSVESGLGFFYYE